MRRILSYKFGILVVLFLLNLSAASCTDLKAATGLDGEALRLGQQYFEERLLKCGDAWNVKISTGNYPDIGKNYGVQGNLVWRPAIVLVQLKNISYTAETRKLSEADRANGWEFDGSVALRAKIWREFNQRPDQNPEKRWSSWQEPFFRDVRISRKDGKWLIATPAGYGGPPMKVDFTCAQVPN